jgi:hypothetical protein
MRFLMVVTLSGLVLGWQASSVSAGDTLPGQLPGQRGSVASVSEAVSVAPPASSASTMVGGSDDDCRGGHVVGGVGLYILKPHFENNPAYTTTAASTVVSSDPPRIITIDTTSSATQQDFSYDLTVSPLIYLGYVADGGLGFRTRWFRFDQGSDASPTTPVAPGGLSGFTSLPFAGSSFGRTSTFAFTSHLLLDVWDFEVTHDLRVGKWCLLWAGGVRYLHMAQRYAAYQSPVSSVDLVPVNPETLVSGHSFNGVGPMLALEAERPLGSSGLSLYGTTRGAVLFGTGKQSTMGQLTITFPGVGGERTIFKNALTAVNNASHNDVLPVLEFEVGVQYGREVGQFYPFVRTGLVGQAYFGAGSATSEDGNLGLFGLCVTAGLHF